MSQASADHISLHATLCAMWRNIDERRFDAPVDQYHADATVRMFLSTAKRDAGEPAVVMRGRDQIIAGHRTHLSEVDATHHSMTNFTADVAGDTATLAAHMRCYHRGAGKTKGLWEESLATLTGSARRTQDGKWAIVSVDHTIVIMLGSLAAFGSGFPAET